MPANPTNRKDVRASLLANLQAYLQTAAPSVQIGYDLANFVNSDIIVQIRDGASERTRRFIGNSQAHVWFYFSIDAYVALNDQSAPTWSTPFVEDTLADLEKYIADFLVDKLRALTVYDEIENAGKTAIRPVMLGNRKFRTEATPVRARVIGG
jgi:hypothetical protein